jgi:hypothetical protein
MNAASPGGSDFILLANAGFMPGRTKAVAAPRKPPFAPQIPKLFNRRRTVPGVVIVCVGVDQHASLPDLIAIIHPALEFRRAVDDGFVPSVRQFFDRLAVAEPSDVRPVGSDRIEPPGELDRSRHCRQVLQHQGDTMLAQQISQARFEPRPVPNLDGKLAIRGELFEERGQDREKGVRCWRPPAVEEWKLEDRRSELLSEEVHGGQEFRKLGVTVHEQLLVRDCLRDFHREDETPGGSLIPVCDRASSRAGVESRVYFDRVEVFGIERQVVGRPNPLGIERSLPAGRAEG